MNEIRTLFERFWICKDTEKELYYKVKREMPEFQRFVREQLGWKLIYTDNLLKLHMRKPLWESQSLRKSGITVFCA